MPDQEVVQTEKKFDLKTHTFNARGILTNVNLYRLHVINGCQLYERPVNSGNLWYENDEPAGRVTYEGTGKIKKKVIDNEAEHIAYVAPLTGDEKLHFDHENLKLENAKLLAEIEQIKKEQEAKTKAAAPAGPAKPASQSALLAAATPAQANAKRESESVL